MKAFLVKRNRTEGNLEEEKRCLFKIIPQSFIHNKVQIITMQCGKKMCEKTEIFHGKKDEKTTSSAFHYVKKENIDQLPYETEQNVEIINENFEKLKKTLM